MYSLSKSRERLSSGEDGGVGIESFSEALDEIGLQYASDVVATIFQKGAIGSVKRKDLTLESTYDPRRMGTLMTARMMVGHNILRPECAVSINKS